MSELSNNNLLNILQERLQEHSRMENVINDLQSKINEMQEKLTESESLKSHFISNITNEIINPFASILGLSQNIMALKDDEIEKAKSIADLIYMEAFQLDFDLKNIFMAAKIEAGEIDPEVVNVDVDKLVSSAIDQFKYEIRRKKIEFVYDFKINKELNKIYYFKTDPEKLKLIVANLISNAIKFSDDSSMVFVTSWLENDLLNVSVKDSGKGIDKDKIQEIFDRFKQLDSTIHSLNRGYGLGLSVTRALIEILNGQIVIAKSDSGGSIFTISIPQSDLDAKDISEDENEVFFGEEEII